MGAVGHQKADHGGNFIMLPRRLLASVAWRYLSHRARSVLLAFCYSHNGRNNGRLELGIHAIGELIGNQNHGGNAKAVAELIDKGFLECTSDADHGQSKVRCYRVTFIATGEPRSIVPASHDYDDWRPTPADRRKFGGARTATQKPDSGAVTARTVKNSGAVTATPVTESRHFEAHASGAVTALSLYNHISGSSDDPAGPDRPLKLSRQIPAADLRADLSTLRTWANEAIDRRGYGGARMLAHDAGIPEVALSRFRNGKNLPDHYRVPLQEACARAIPFNQLAA